MANEDFGLLSPEQVQKLANTISDAKNLTVQQEEIIKRVLEGENDIGKTRIAYLEQYFDTYSKNLDLVARKHSSLNDAFLILEKKLSRVSNNLASDIGSLQSEISGLAKSLSDTKSDFTDRASTTLPDSQDKSSGAQKSSEELNNLTVKLIKAFNDAGKIAVTYAKKSTNELLEIEREYQAQRLEQLKRFGQSNAVSHRGGGLSHRAQRRTERDQNAADQKGTHAAHEAGRRAAVQDVATHEINARNELQSSQDEVAATIEAVVRAVVQTRNVVDENQREGLNTVTFTELTDLFKDIAKINAWHPETEQARKDGITSQKNALAHAESNYKDTVIDLAIAKSATSEQRALLETELTLSKLQEAATAEVNLQKQKNKTRAELASKNNIEAANARSITINSTEELRSRQAIEAEVLTYRAQLEQEYRAKHNGELTAADVLTIEALAKVEHEAKLKNLDEYTNARLNSEKLAGLKAYDPKLAEKLETEVAEKVDRKVREIKQASNGVISKEQLEDAKRQALAEMDFREKHLDDLRKKNFSEESRLRIQQYDPKAFEAFERKRAQRIAELEHEYRSRQHGKLFDGDKKEIQERVNAEEKFNVLTDQGRQLLDDIGEQNLFESSIEQLKNGLNATTGKAIEERIAKRRRELEDDDRARNNGKRTIDDEQINNQLRTEFYGNEESFKQYEDRITNIIFKQEKAEERLARIKEADAEEAAEIELDMALLRAQLEAEARAAHSGELHQQELDNIDERIAVETSKRTAQKYTDDTALAEKKANNLVRQKYQNDAPDQLANFDKNAKLNLIKLEYDLRRKNNGKLDDDARKALKKKAAEEYKLTEANQARLDKAKTYALKKQLEEEEKARTIAGDQAVDAAVSGPLTKENNLVERFKQLNELTKDETGERVSGAGLTVAIKALSSLISKLDDTIAKVGSYKGDIDTRLHGSKQDKTKLGSYWDQLQRDMASIGAITPFFKQEDFANNIKALVDKGIAHDLKQRAFLMTIQEKIANTFDVADASLLRLVRLQQADSTAARLGMEAALNEFLNNMYETTEYLTDVAGGVRGSLEEMEALMGAKAATEVEYQVQKWMGSLYSVGMSSSAVQSIATALGQLAAGQIDPLTSGDGAGNLLIMAANKSGKPIADILTDGLDATETNKLLQATVDYLAEIANASKDNNVVQQQLAGVFGVKASDLKAAVNLSSDAKKVASDNMTYDNMLKELNNMASTMALRTSVGEMMTNIWDNVQFSLSSGVANNPISYFTYKMASLLDAVVGGIPLPGISVMGNMVNLRTSVADLMRVGAMSGGIMSMLPQMIQGLGTSFSGKAMLKKLGIDEGNGLNVVQRGNGRGSVAKSIDSTGNTSLNIGGGSSTLSDSGYVGNANTSDILDSTLQGAEDKKKSLMVEAKAAEEVHQIDNINVNVLKIYELLDEVASGKRSLRVRLSDYALSGDRNTSGNGWTSGSTGVGGVTGGNNYGTTGDATSSGGAGYADGTGNGGYGTQGGSYESSNDFSSGNGVSLGGWTVI
jgi:hypothetical protein